MMKFDYAVYLRQDCHVPLSLALFCVVLLAVALASLIRSRKTNGWRDYAGFTVILCIMGYLLSVNAVHLSRGGIYLLVENESSQVQVEGTVEETIEIDSITGSKYRVEGQYSNNGNGEGLVINGETYYLISYGDTKTGDFVRLSVLPKSHFVMRLENESNWLFD